MTPTDDKDNSNDFNDKDATATTGLVNKETTKTTEMTTKMTTSTAGLVVELLLGGGRQW